MPRAASNGCATWSPRTAADGGDEADAIAGAERRHACTSESQIPHTEECRKMREGGGVVVGHLLSLFARLRRNSLCRECPHMISAEQAEDTSDYVSYLFTPFSLVPRCSLRRSHHRRSTSAHESGDQHLFPRDSPTVRPTQVPRCTLSAISQCTMSRNLRPSPAGAAEGDRNSVVFQEYIYPDPCYRGV
jgi:hypothetical protein